MRKREILINFIGSNENYCEGIRPLMSAGTYLLGTQLSVAKKYINYSHPGSSVLDEIMVFDLAEVAGATLGQINIIKVSSFCGPGGLIWGYDICPVEKISHPWKIKTKNGSIPVYSLDNLCIALKKLFGTIERPRFPIFPGSHIFCAIKYITAKGKKNIYAAKGIGIAKKRNRQACILLEDVGIIPLSGGGKEMYKKMLLRKLSKCLADISQNQKIELKEMFVGIKDIFIDEDEIGCAMVASPYFSLARKAVPENDNLFTLKLNDWENAVKDNFLNHGAC